MSINLIDSNGNYEPGNCRWATYAEQQQNKRNLRTVVYRGKRTTYTQIAKRYGVKRSILYDRVHRYGWSIKKAITTPVKSCRTLIVGRVCNSAAASSDYRTSA